jgi:hypothetical protein
VLGLAFLIIGLVLELLVWFIRQKLTSSVGRRKRRRNLFSTSRRIARTWERFENAPRAAI